jgi:hypothetical protein
MSAAVPAIPDFIRMANRMISGFEIFLGVKISTNAAQMSTRVSPQAQRLVLILWGPSYVPEEKHFPMLHAHHFLTTAYEAGARLFSSLQEAGMSPLPLLPLISLEKMSHLQSSQAPIRGSGRSAQNQQFLGHSGHI